MGQLGEKTGAFKSVSAYGIMLWCLLFMFICLPVVRQQAEAAPMPGRMLSSTGAAWGGIVMFNSDGSNVVNLTSNTFDNHGKFPPGQERTKDYFPSVSGTGLVAFLSGRDGTGNRIYTMNPDGSNVRQVTTYAGVHTDPYWGYISDENPVISPDGSRICFIGRRVEVERSPGVYDHPYRDIYVVNVDGSQLTKVTEYQEDPAGHTGSQLWTCAWNPDGTKILFKGYRLHLGQIQTVLGLINPDGTQEEHLDVLNSPGVGSELAMDWSPDGRYIVNEYGGGAQGAAYPRYFLYEMSGNVVVARTELTEASLGNYFSMGAGTVRFSPDSGKLLYLVANIPYTGSSPTIINLDGTGKTAVPYTLAGGQALWWTAGQAIPAPARLELAPNPVLVRRDGVPVPIVPTLYDVNNEFIAHAATAWITSPLYAGSPCVSITGEVIAYSSTDYRNYTISATNAGITASTTVNIVPNGDLSGNSSVDIADALYVLRITVKLIQPDAAAITLGDVFPLDSDGKPFGDGVIDIRDCLCILRAVVGLVTW
jgi:hypothetical protein